MTIIQKPNAILASIVVAVMTAGFFISQPVWAAIVDADQDGLSDAIEIKLGTDANNPDTDNDGYYDGAEIKNGFSPFEGGRSRKITRAVETDLTTQKFYYLVNGVRIGEMLASTGRPGVPTPTGEYKILKKIPVKTYRTVTGGSYPNTKWNMLFEAKRGLYLHGAYWHNDFGIRPRSGGCINLTTADASQIYKFLDVGDKIKVYGKTPSGKVKITSAKN
ncbi:MAG: L,D-transpeptidase [Candidatus Magasanikbacteria bacterium]|jgi:lipoprotein-anchoring transpeptidase ErfK/SrfK